MTKPFRYYLRVRYQECDAQHVVFNARYGDYIDHACIEFLRAALPRPHDAMDGTFEIQTVRQVIEWKAPARFDDVLEDLGARRAGSAPPPFVAELSRCARPARPTCSSTSETIYVHVDPKTWKQARDRARRCAPRSKPAPPARLLDHAGYLR